MLAGVCTCDVFSPQCLAVKKNPTLNSHLGDNPAHNLPDFILRQLFHSLRALMVCHVPLEGAKPQESVVVERVPFEVSPLWMDGLQDTTLLQ